MFTKATSSILRQKTLSNFGLVRFRNFLPVRLLAADAATKPAANDFSMTDACVQRLAELRRKHGGATKLRVEVEPGGCSGHKYIYKLEQKSAEDDLIFRRGDAEVLVDPVSFAFIKGSTIDWQHELAKQSFAIVDNPNVEQGCGCKQSFTVKEAAS